MKKCCEKEYTVKLLVSHGQSTEEPEESSLLKSVERHGDWTAGGQGISQVFLFDPHRHVTSRRNYRCFIEGILLIPRRETCSASIRSLSLFDQTILVEESRLVQEGREILRFAVS